MRERMYVHKAEVDWIWKMSLCGIFVLNRSRWVCLSGLLGSATKKYRASWIINVSQHTLELCVWETWVMETSFWFINILWWILNATSSYVSERICGKPNHLRIDTCSFQFYGEKKSPSISNIPICINNWFGSINRIFDKANLPICRLRMACRSSYPQTNRINNAIPFKRRYSHVFTSFH